MSHLVVNKDDGRVFIIGDLHGSYDKFMEMLDDVDFDYGNDLIISTGDLVDRGDKSLDCFNLLSKHWFIAVEGNHEQMMIDILNHSITLNQHIGNGGEWFNRLPKDVQQHLAKRAAELPITITLNRKGKKYGIVHGDIPRGIDDWDVLTNDIDHYKVDCIWGRYRVKAILNHPGEPIKINTNISNIDHVYLGHTILQKVSTIGNMTFLDTGCVLPYLSSSCDDSIYKLSWVEL